MKKDRIKIMYEDKFIIVIDKPAHLLSIATEKEKEQTMYHKVLMYENIVKCSINCIIKIGGKYKIKGCKEIYEKEKNTQNYCNYFSNNYTGGRYVYKCHIT